jgi:hypothetical protein
VAQRNPSITFEDIPLDQARRITRGPRIHPDLYNALKAKIQSLHNTATRMTFSEGTRPDTMKNRITRVADDLNIPLTIRRVPGGLIFWRSTDEDLVETRQAVPRLQSTRHPLQASSRGRRGRG